MTPLARTTRNQNLAANPENSAFVMANAGAGKTRVLTNRVARLLLEKVAPAQILCITFTKAAAAEMAERLFRMLGEWALLDDDKLNQELRELEGDDARERSEAELNDARCLFARALETPGGLKIQTIHSFCEGILKRFPLEAGAPPGFSVIEEGEARRLIGAAIDELAQQVDQDAVLASDIERLSVLRTENDLRGLLASEANAQLRYDALLLRHGALDEILRSLAADLDVDAAGKEDQLLANYFAELDIDALRHAKAVLETGSADPKKRAADIARFLSAQTLEDKRDALSDLLLTGKGGPRKTLATKAIGNAHPDIETFLRGLQASLISLLEKFRALAIYHDTAAHYRTVARLREGYEHKKAARAVLDFDDLIALTRRLLEREDAAWVRYKLDFGIDHVLVDETQDTSPEQWEVIGALIEDYLSGSGARDALRTFFAVGDVKQSIYSFQGADAALFEERENTLGKSLAAYHQMRGAGDYKLVDLNMSFRTTAPVLEFVDAVFDDEDAREGLGRLDNGLTHQSGRDGHSGIVELWPLTPKAEKQEANAWDAPVDAPAPGDPVAILSDQIASTIKGWLDSKEKLESIGRAIEPGDVMILVQSRGRLFDAILSTLARKGVPVAGADRLKLMEDPVVEDLLSYAKFCVLVRDDLSLAETLKSPLFNFDDDADLFPLAHERGDGQSLWGALEARAGENEKWRNAFGAASQARPIALREGPSAFLSHVLDSAGGRKAFYSRVSQSSREAIDEMVIQALDFEQGQPRSLRAFINWFEDNAATIKREMDRTEEAVRVMTAHGAKGLEANIVFLIDAHRYPNVKDIGFPLELVDDNEQAPRTGRHRLLVGAKERDTNVTAAAREAKKAALYEEYRRLFYVAATRARDRLYIAGVESGNERDPLSKPVKERSWHSLACDAFERLKSKPREGSRSRFAEAEGGIRRWFAAQDATPKRDDEKPAAPPVEQPAWLEKPAPEEAPVLRLSPSRLADEEEADAALPALAPAASPTGADKYFRGRTIHRLLELLPEVDVSERAAAADRLLARLAPEIAPEERSRWRGETLAVLSDPAFSAVFGPGSRAEVGIAGKVNGRLISGQVDRLMISDREIFIVDYKTNRPPPRTVEETSPAYVAQMAAYRALLQQLYPDHQISCALLWTFEARLSLLPESLLDHAGARWLGPG